MILVTLGTQDKSFKRLLKAIDKKIEENKITDKVVVQAGMTHGGVGSIITGLRNNKKVIAAARLKKYKEHTNDHQLQIIENFKESGFLLELDNFDDVDKKVSEAKKFKPHKYKSNKQNFINLVDELIKESMD